MQDAELCKELLQIILPELDIEHVEYPEVQKSLCLDVLLTCFIRDDIFIPLKILGLAEQEGRRIAEEKDLQVDD